MPVVPAKAGTHDRCLWNRVSSISAFTRVFDALCAGTTAVSERKARSAPAGCCGLRVVDAERRSDQVIDEVDLGAAQIAHGNLIDQHGRTVAPNHDIVGPLGAVDVEF